MCLRNRPLPTSLFISRSFVSVAECKYQLDDRVPVDTCAPYSAQLGLSFWRSWHRERRHAVHFRVRCDKYRRYAFIQATTSFRSFPLHRLPIVGPVKPTQWSRVGEGMPCIFWNRKIHQGPFSQGPTIGSCSEPHESNHTYLTYVFKIQYTPVNTRIIPNCLNMKSVPRSKHAPCWVQKPVSQCCIGPTRERAWWLQRQWQRFGKLICNSYVARALCSM